MRKSLHYIAVSGIALGVVAAFALREAGEAGSVRGAGDSSVVRSLEVGAHDWQTFGFMDDAGEEAPARRPPSADELRRAGEARQRVAVRVMAEDGAWVRIVDGHGRGVVSDLLVSAPGMFPFEVVRTDADGLARLPLVDATTLSNRPVTRYEILARSVDRDAPMGFWGEYDAPAASAYREGMPEGAHATAVEAGDVRFRVRTPGGEPAAGVHVRLARGAVGLLSLTSTTDAEGRASFTRLPPGTYTTTFDAEGIGRTVVTVDHRPSGAPTGGGAEETTVTLEAGGNYRMPEAWRARADQLAIPTLPGASRPDPDAADGAAADDDDEPADDGAARSQVRVFVVDAYGAPVQGALFELWSGSRRLGQGTSRGTTPVEIAVPGEVDARLVAVHAGWGEGEEAVYLEAGESGEVVVHLDRPLFSSRAIPGRLTDPGEIAALLEADLVADGNAWLIDADDPDSAARRAGIERGDSLVGVRKQGAGYEVTVERRGEIARLRL